MTSSTQKLLSFIHFLVFRSGKVNLLLLYFSFLFTALAHSQDFEWAKHITCKSNIRAWNSCMDDESNLYVTGVFRDSVDFDPSASTNFLFGINHSAFVAKYDSNGVLLWAKQFENSGTHDALIGNSWGHDIGVDNNNNVFIGGEFYYDSVDFDPGLDTFILVPQGFGATASFICKLDSNGNFIHAIQFEEVNALPQVVNSCLGLVMGNSGELLITGVFTGTVDFDPTSGVHPIASSGDKDIYVCKLDTALNLVWVKSFGGSLEDRPQDIEYGQSNSIYVTGSFKGVSDFDPGPASYNLTATNSDIFTLKLTDNGEFVWVARMGGNSFEIGNSIALDANENVIITGDFKSNVDFDPGPSSHILNAGSNFDGFICKLDSSSNFIWAKQIGNSSSDDYGRDITVDSNGNIFTTGEFIGTIIIPFGNGNYQLSSSGGLLNRDIYLMKLLPNGETNWVKGIGGTPGQEYSYAINVSPTESIYTVGNFSSVTDFDTGIDTLLLSPIAGYDMFLHKMRKCPQSYSNLTVSSCGDFNSPGGKTYSSSGVYVEILETQQGCDSIVTIDLTVFQPTYSQLTVHQDSCIGYTSPSGTHYWDSTAVYTDTIPNNAGCDSIIEIQLFIDSPSSSFISVNACENYLTPGGHLVDSSGIYSDTITNVFGCDSIITIDLFVSQITTTSISEVSCSSYTSPSGNYVWDSSGVYLDTLVNAFGCDSILSVSLTILPSRHVTIDTIVCEGMSSPSGNSFWSTSGVYNDTLTALNNCDSIVTVNLTVHSSDAVMVDTTVCNQMVSPSGLIWNSTGFYHDTLVNALGCDSIITFDLTVIPIVAQINNQSDTLLMASPQGADSYEWLDCNSNQILQSGISPEYNLIDNGSYAVIVTQGNCSDTSECADVFTLSTHALNSQQIVVFPNPTSSGITIIGLHDNQTITLEDTQGRVLKTIKTSMNKVIQVDLPHAQGLYFLKILDSKGKMSFETKILKYS